MDARKRRTLRLIVSQVHRLTVEERGRQLVLVARDYLEDDDVVAARAALQLVDRVFFDDHLLPLALHEDFGAALADVVEVFGLELEINRRPRGEA